MGKLDTNRLDVLAGEIKLINQQTCDAIQQLALHGAIEIGKRLCEAKKLVGHGEWGTWLEKNVDYSQDTASRFMNVYKGYLVNGNSAPVRNLNFMQAVALLGIKNSDEREAFIAEKHGVVNKNGETEEKTVEDMSKREIEKAVKEYNAMKARAEKAEQERDETKTENVQLKANFSTAVSDKAFEIQGESVRAKKAAEQARDEAEAKAESFRAKADAYDDLQKANHSLREKIRQQADELANRPNVETVVTKEVVPEEYKKALLENQQLKKELAAHRAHAQNMTVQELAQTDKEFDDLQKSYEEEERTSKRLEYFETLSSFFPEGQIEARELARCFLKFHGNEPAIVHTVQQNLRLAIDSMTWIYDALTAKPKLEVVK